MLFTIIIFIEAFCFIIALWMLRKEASWWKYFIPFLVLTLAVEITGYILYFVKGLKNHWVFNLYLPLEMAFLFFALYRLCKSYFKPGIFLTAGYFVFLVVYLWNSFHSGWQDYSGPANTLASLLIILTAVLFYYYLLKNEAYVELTRFPAFWFVSGLFVFYLGALAVNLFGPSLIEVYKKTGIPVRYIIMLVLNFILYGCWSYAFICNYRYQIRST